MRPQGWLAGELAYNEWGLGALYNLWLVENTMIALGSDTVTYRGRLQCPNGHYVTFVNFADFPEFRYGGIGQ